MLQSALGRLDAHVGWDGWEAAAHGPADSITIPDAHVLFSGDFKRAGVDLVISDREHEFVVRDYFRGEHRPALLSPDGARLTADVVEALTGHGDYAQAGTGQNAAAPVAVGRVAKVEGSATIIRNGVAITVNTGDAVLKGDVLQTGAGVLGVTFTDGSTLNLAANSRLMVNDFVYVANGSANSEILNLVQGSLSFISGEVAHSGGDMKITTPVATMGIRGTVGGVTEADDGTVKFFVVESATGAVLTDSQGRVLAQVVQDGPLIQVRPTGPLTVLAEELQKSPQELAAELAILQEIVNTQAIGQQILQQILQQNNQNPHSTGTDHTQIEIDIPKTAILGNGTGITNIGGPPSSDNTATVKTTTTDQNGNTTTTEQQVPVQPNPPPASVATPHYWNQNSASNDPSDPANWDPQSTPGSNDDLVIGRDQTNNPVPDKDVTYNDPLIAHSLSMYDGAQLFADDITIAGDIAVFGDGSRSTEIVGDFTIHDLGGNLFLQSTASDAVIRSTDNLIIGNITGSLTVEADAPAGQCSAAHAEIVACGPDLSIGSVGGDFELSATTETFGPGATAEINSAGDLSIGNIVGDFKLTSNSSGLSGLTEVAIVADGNIVIGTIGGDFDLDPTAGGLASATANILSAHGDVVIGDVAGNFTLESAFAFLSSATAEISAACGDIHIGNIGGYFFNQGTIDADNGVLSIGTVGGSFVNDGLMSANELHIAANADGALCNQGTIVVSGSAYCASTIGVDVGNGGLITAADGAVLEFFGLVDNLYSGTIMATSGGEIDFNGCSVDNCGTIEASNGGVVNLSSVYGFGTLAIDGGLIYIASANTNDVQFSNSSGGGELFLNDPSEFYGLISGFDESDMIGLLGVNLTVAGYDAGAGVLDLHPVHGGSDIFLSIGTQYDESDFVTLYNGFETILLDRPSGVVQGGQNGVWTNPNDGDWGTAGNWDNDVVPGSSDEIVFSNLINGQPASYTATFDGAFDGIPGYGIATVASLAVAGGVTFAIFNNGELFLGGNLDNDGTIDANDGQIVAGGDGSNNYSGIISISGTSGSASGQVDVRGAFANDGAVTAFAGGSASFGSVTGIGLLTISGGVITIDDLDTATSSDVVDTNDITFDTANGTLILGGQGQIDGHITGFAAGDSIFFLNEQVTVLNFVDNGNSTAVLTLHLHSTGGDGDSDLTLLLNGDYVNGEFATQFDGLNSQLFDTLTPVQSGGGTPNGEWTNAAGGDWGTAANWSNSTVPGAFDAIVLDTPVGQTVTFNGGIDGLPGYGLAQAGSLEVGSGVTFQVTRHGDLFFQGDLDNSGAILVSDSSVSASDDGSNANGSTITVEGTSGLVSSTFDINGAFTNNGTVTADARGEASFGSVSGSGLLVIDGGAMALDELGALSSNGVADTNDIQFAAGNGTLILGGQGQINGHITGFAAGDSIFFLDEQVSITSFDDNTGTLTLHLHSTDGGSDSNLTLLLNGSYAAGEFATQFDGLNSQLFDTLAPVQSGGGTPNGEWTNAAGGDWGTAANWSNSIVPGQLDAIVLDTPMGHTVTFNGGIDGMPGYGFAQAASLEVGANVTFQINNRGDLFIGGGLTNTGTVDVLNSGLSFAAAGTNSGLITIEGTTGAISSTFDMDNGALANSGTVDAKTRGDATIRSVTGNGLLKIDGGVLTLGGFDVTSAATTDTNGIEFAAANGLLLLEGQGQVAGHISGFAASDSVGFTDEQVTVASYDSGTGVLQLHLHSLQGLGDHDLSLTFDGLSDGDFTAQFDGLNSLLYFNPIPAPVHGGAGAGVWSNAHGGDWGVASNWQNGAVPGYSDDITLNTPVGHAVTFNGAIDGFSGFVSAGALTVGAGVVFQITNSGHLFFTGALTNTGTVDVLNSGLSFAADGTNSGLITIEGTTGAISSTFDIDNGALANSGIVDAKAHGWATIRSVTGNGVLKIDGGVLALGGTDVTTGQTIDTNEIQFAAANGFLMLDGQGQVAGHISGFGASDSVGFIDEQVTVTSYDSNTGVLQLHLHSLDGLGDHNLSLTFDGLSDGDFTAQFDGLNSLLYFNPIPAPVHGGAGAGVWSNVQGGDWGVAGNWQNGAVPGYSDDITLNTPVGHAVTFNGASDGLSGFATADSLTVSAGVTFQVTNSGHLFFMDELHNSGAIDVLDASLSVGGDGGNSGTIDVHGSFGFISSTLDIAGTFANTSTVVAGDHGSVGLASVTGSGVLVIDGGAISIDGADTNDVQFSTAHSGTLLLGDAAEFAGHISGFAPVVNVNDLATAPAISLQAFDATSVNYVDSGNHSGVLHLLNGGTDIALNLYGDYSTANFSANYDGLETLITDQGPVISAAHIDAVDNGGSTTVSGLSIADLFEAGNQFAFTMTAGDGTLALADSNDALNGELSSNGSNGTLSATASLSEINTALGHGFVYTPNVPEPPTDNVSIKIEDVTGGAIDELNLVFNQAGSGPDVTLAGTNGKDVLYATGFNDTLTGGASSDTFVFREFGNAGTPNTDTISDFNVFQDYLNFDQAHFANTAALLAATSDVNGHAVITVHDGSDTVATIALTNVTTAQLAAHQDHILLAA